MPTVSVIVPCFNVECTLERCVNGILNQTFKDIELIIVNDGSCDTTKQIIDKYTEFDPRIVAIHKINGGVSSARNTGLDVAKGEYIAFADADDEILPQWIETFMRIIGDADIAVQGIDFVGSFTETKSIVSTESCDVKVLVEELMKGQVLGYLFSKLFRHKIIESNHIRFDETIRFREDDVFMLEYAQHINRWAATDKSNYIYYVPSAEKEYGSNATDCTEKVFDLLYKIFSGRIPQTILNNQAWSVKGAVVKKILSNDQISPMLLNAYRQTFSPAKGLRQKILNFLILNNEFLGSIPKMILRRIN